MKTIKVKGKILKNEDFFIQSTKESEEGIDLDTPSTLVNLIKLKKKIRESLLDEYCFHYSLPISFMSKPITNAFKADFPIIF